MLTALPFVVSPGASFTITVGAALAGDRRAGIRVWAGTALGILIIAAVFGASGFGTLIAGNRTTMTIWGLVGGAALIAFGLMALMRALRNWDQSLGDSTPAARLVGLSFVAVITNVKALSLYVVVVPALRGTGLSGLTLFLVFAMTHIALMLVWLLLVTLTVSAFPSLGRSSRARGVLLVAAAVVLILLGGATAVTAVL
ncbi:LysE family transporter [Agreia sp. PsM10]|uniref:LysE family transporter n=1 Tax=Agreia sp. PsM10 TaxID=3030533 RepID=UPI00263A70B6|nr:LysE family transporter [Agreia sp. PsM10]MDN4640632.1 LysE family transporter [Agreia sp. PsM10]